MGELPNAGSPIKLQQASVELLLFEGTKRSHFWLKLEGDEECLEIQLDELETLTRKQMAAIQKKEGAGQREWMMVADAAIER